MLSNLYEDKMNKTEEESDEVHKTVLPVYLRLKPKTAGSQSESFLTTLPGNIQVQVEPPKGSRYKTEETFSFTGVFRETCGQLDIFKGVVRPLVENVLHGHDSLFFTMGASGSGKSHTTLGYKQTPGMIHMAIDTIFKSIGKNLAEFEFVESISDKNSARTSSAVEAGLYLDWSKNTSTKTHLSTNSVLEEKIDVNEEKYSYAVYLSMVEIYNDRIFNLLDDSPNPQKRRALITKTDPDTGKTYLADLQKIYVSERIEAYRVLEQGLAQRKANSTGLNNSSSRSHAFTLIEVKRIPKKPRKVKKDDESNITSSVLSIVDLAGSERNKIAKTVGTRLVESCAINKSLMLLGQCLQKQRDKERTDGQNVKSDPAYNIFRNSKLTQLLLSNAFIPELKQKSVILVTIDPYGDYNSASQMLRYSALARDIVVPKNRISSLSSLSSMSGESSSTLADSDSTRSFSTSSHGSNFSDLSGESLTESNSNVKYLLQRIRELEVIAIKAEDKCLRIEEEVRMEMSNEMERVLQSTESRYLDRIDEDYDQSQQLMDQKIELLINSIRETELKSLQNVIDDLQAENNCLQKENVQLKEQFKR